jgi:predicted dithiol-disulfide oxidoreductase (DUF899 family)
MHDVNAAEGRSAFPPAGCSAVADSVGHLAHLHARDTRVHDEYQPEGHRVPA